MLVIFLGLLVATNSLELVPPPNTWVRQGENNVTLVCTASDKIRSCSWSTPYGKTYPLESGLMAEGGRLLHFTTDKDKECGVLITNIEDKDDGRWKCNVGVVENSEVSTASGMANVNIATAPDTISLEKPYDQLSTNFTLGAVHDVKCVAKNAKPAPKFYWKIDKEDFDGKTMDEEVFVDISGLSIFTQVLSYKPAAAHANKTLRCVVDHPGLVNTVSAATAVNLVGDDDAPLGVASLTGVGVAGVVLAAIGVVVVLTVISVLVFRAKFSGEEKKERLDEEKGAIDADADKTSQTESAHDEIKQDAKKNFQSKITAFFAAIKPKEKNGDEIVATEWEKVDISAAADKTEPEEEEKGDKEKETETEGATKSENFQEKFSSFFAKFRQNDRKSTKSEKEALKEVKDEDATEELKELEPEDKEDISADEKERRIGSETPV